MSYNVGKQSGALFIGCSRNRQGGRRVPLCIEPTGLSSPRSVRTRKNARAIRLLHATLVALALFAFGSQANAAVPMCSDDGRTIAAPPIMRPSSGRVLESRGDCERLRALLTRSNPGDQQRGSLQAGDAPLRAVPARAVVPAAPRVVRLVIASELGRARPATTLDVFRPPRRG
jgi:hypothetical protein